LARGMGFHGLEDALAGAGRAAALECDPASPWRSLALLVLGWLQYLSGDSALARSSLTEAARLSEGSFPIIEADALANLSLIAFGQGQLREAEARAGAARRVAQKHSVEDSPTAAVVYTAWGRMLAGQGRISEALVELECGLTLQRSVPGLSPWPTIQHLLIH